MRTSLLGGSNIIHLTTPAADRATHPDTITKPQLLRAWVDDLPFANQLGTAQALLSSLKLINRQPVKPAQRSELMAIYMNPFCGIMDVARRLSCQSQNGQTKTKVNSELLALAGAICAEMAYGYKHIVLAEANSEIKYTPNEIAAHIQLAMHCLSLGLMFEMSAYRPEARSAWREIFQLLIRAQLLGAANLPIQHPIPEVAYEVSVLNTFKCILLTSILDTSRLSPEEIWASYDFLSWHAKTARLTSLEHASQHPGNYIMPRDGQLKPVLYNPDQPPSDPDKYMLCETHKLNLLISNHLETLATDDSAVIRGTDGMTADNKKQMLRTMLHIWHINPKRRHERKSKFDRLSCAFGVASAYYFLKKGTMHSGEAETEYGQHDLARDYPLNHPAEPKLSDNLHTYECRQGDISASGMGILTSEHNIDNLKIGQIVIAESEIGYKPAQIKMGVVRRIIQQDQSTTQVGIQYLPGRLFAATALPEIFGRQHRADLQPCLLLELGEKQPKAIITPHMIYQASRHYILDIAGGDTKRVIAGKLLETTGCFDCFEYNVLGEG